MIKDIAWKTFKNTGNINTFLELMKVEATEQQIKENAKFAVFNDNFIPSDSASLNINTDSKRTTL